jgi:hypothetical protein
MRRLPPTLAVALTVALGLAARAWLPSWPAKYVGVALYGTLLFMLAWWLRPTARVARLALAATVACWLIELAQLTAGPAWLSSRHALLRLALGATFSAYDLLTYPVGVAAGAGVLWLVRRGRCTPARSMQGGS